MSGSEPDLGSVAHQRESLETRVGAMGCGGALGRVGAVALRRPRAEQLRQAVGGVAPVRGGVQGVLSGTGLIRSQPGANALRRLR